MEKWSRARVIEKLQHQARTLGYSPTQADVPEILVKKAREYFGSWNEAKQAASLEAHPQRGVRRTHIYNNPVVPRIRAYLDNNPSTWREMRRNLHLDPEQHGGMSGIRDVRHVGPKGEQIYYLVGQEHLLPPEYR